ncbi:MAG: hypothetical protein M3296_00915 [Actinomycetota bacterium]|nr:hypothetical protein [Actinomycetota bacterium]
MLEILIAAFTLLRLGGSAGMALARGGGGVLHSRAQERSQSGAEYEAADVAFLGGGLRALAVGDRSRTWQWPGTHALDRLSHSLPALLVRRSPLLARLVADGTYLRAILGSASLLGPLAALALGAAAVRNVGGEALPPATGLTIAIAVIGVFDAAAGLLAALAFAGGVLALGGVDSIADVRLVVGLGALWLVVPVVAGAARPLRRRPRLSLTAAWDRGADFVIDSLIGAWAAQKIVLALPALAGVEHLPIAQNANKVALCVLAALVVRLAFESLAAHLYPRRLDASEAGGLSEPGALQRLAASALRTAIFAFVAYSVVGSHWQLWAGAVLFIVPQLLAVYEERLPNSATLFRALPKGLVELVFILSVTTAVAAALLITMNERSSTFLANSFVLLALPGFLLSVLNVFGRDGDDRSIRWGHRIAGIAVLAAGVFLVLGSVL